MKKILKVCLRLLLLPLMILFNPLTIGLFRRAKEFFYSGMVSLYLGRGIGALYCKDFPRFHGKRYLHVKGYCAFGMRNKIECYAKYENERYQPELTIGDGVTFGDDCHVGCINRIEIGAHTLIGSHVMIMDHAHGSTELNAMPPLQQPLTSKGPVIIGENCWIGEKAMILPGVKIGSDCIIGAGAVVTKSFEGDGLVLAGNPARIVKRREVSADVLKDTVDMI